jgi:hypothetical protein
MSQEERRRKKRSSLIDLLMAVNAPRYDVQRLIMGGDYNKYGHLTWKESRPENTELRHRNEAERAAKRAAAQ